MWWLVWVRKTAMLVMKLRASVVSWLWSTQLSTESWPTGMTWKRYGIIPSTMSWELLLKSTQCCWLRLLLTLKPTGRRWPRSCSRHSTVPPCTLTSKLCSLCTLLDEQLDACWTLVMVSPTPCLSTRVTPCPTLLFDWISLDVTLLVNNTWHKILTFKKNFSIIASRIFVSQILKTFLLILWTS